MDGHCPFHSSLTIIATGCFTCRVRRKKCDEGHPACGACTKLFLKCDYTKPAWWVSLEQRQAQKDRIKARVRQTKVMEKEGNLQGMYGLVY